MWCQDMSQAADPRAKLSRAAVRWALVGLVVHHLTVARIADVLAVSWNTANTAILGEGQRILIDDPDHFEGVRVIGVDEHVWRHTPYGDKYVTVILDLTPIRDRRGPSRLLDMIPGRSKRVFKTWLASQPHTWRERIEVIAMDGFTGFKSAAAEELPDARAVMDPFHVVRLAGDALDECRRRIQQELHHRRGRPYRPHGDRHTGKNAQTAIQRYPGLLRPPPHHRRSHRSHQRPPRTPTRLHTRTCETSPTTPPEHSPKQEDSKPNDTPTMKSPFSC